MAIDTLPTDFADIAAVLQTQISNDPIDDVDSYRAFELALKREFTQRILAPVVSFLDDFNPVPNAVSNFFDTEVLNVPGLNDILDDLGVPRTPRQAIELGANTFGGTADVLRDALNDLDFFSKINDLETSVSQALSTNTRDRYNQLFDEVEAFAGVSLPLLNTIDATADAPGVTSAQLASLAASVVDTLEDGVGPLPQVAFEFDLTDDDGVRAKLFNGSNISPFGADVGIMRAGATLNVGEITATLDYRLQGSVSLADGLSISKGEVTAGIGLGATAALGLQIGSFELNAATATATLSGELGVKLSPALDVSGDGAFQVSELLAGSDCYFDTTGGIRFFLGGTYIDPNPVSQVVSFVTRGRSAERNFTIFNEVVWSADLNSCNPSTNGSTEVMDGMLIVQGTGAADTIVITLANALPTSPKLRVDRNGQVTSYDASTISKIIVETLGGDDVISVSPEVEVPSFLDGGAGKDSIVGGGGDDELFGGTEDDNLDGGLGDDVVHGGAGNDVIVSREGLETLLGDADNDVFDVAGATYSATVVGDLGNDELRVQYVGGLDRYVNFDAGPDSDLIGLTGGGAGFHGDYYVGPTADRGTIAYRDPLGKTQSIEFAGLEPINDLMVAVDLTVHGSASNDVINVVNGPVVAATQTTLVNFNGAFEEIRVANKPTLIVDGEGRNDQITVNNPVPGAALVDLRINGNVGEDAITATPFASGVQITVDGGPSSGRDTLNVIDSVGGRRIELRQDLDPEAGSIRVVGAETVFFSEIERLHSALTTDPDLVVLKGDPYEPNDTLATAWYLGSGAVINVDPTIEPGGDVDFYRFVADETGTLDFQVFFAHADGDIDIRVRDAAGNVIASSLSVTDDERITIPAIADRTYFLEVFGATEDVDNVYSFSVLNDAAPVPMAPDLLAATASGRNNTDDVTFFGAAGKPALQVDVVLDDDRLDEFALLNLIPDSTNDDQATAGADYGVEMFNKGVSIGFAFFTGVGNTWRFASTVGDVAAGDDNRLTAAVWVRDRSTPAALSRGRLSEDLQITLDVTTPPVSFGLPDAASVTDGLIAADDSGVAIVPPSFADRVTSDTTPRLWGRAEADAVVRVFVDLDNDGVIDLPNAAGVGGDVLIGQTVATPFDGNDAYPDGFWEISGTLDLSDLVGLPPAGLRRLLVTAEDVAGNPMAMNLQLDDAALEIADGVDELPIFLDAEGPQITDVTINNLSSAQYDLFDPKPTTSGPTPLVTSLRLAVRDLPNRLATDFVYNALVPSIASAPGNFVLVGDRVGPVAIQSIAVTNDAAQSGLPATASIVLTFAAPLPDDRFTLTVRDSLVDPAGNRLDGESGAVEPQEDPLLRPDGTRFTGDGVPGGDFVARFTVDSRPEIASVIPQQITVDINGNFIWDPASAQSGDAVNVDLTFTMQVRDGAGVAVGGFGVHDLVFAGKFLPSAGAGTVGRLFDQLAVYGNSQDFGGDRWLIDLNSNGVVDLPAGELRVAQPSLLAFNGFNVTGALPVAGNFDGNAANGDEIGLYNAGRWALDANRNFVINPGDEFVSNNLLGAPVVGDFDGDGRDDLAVFNNNVWKFDLRNNGFGQTDATLVWGFPGVLDRPVAADMDRDGIDDIGLWVPRTNAQNPEAAAEWYFLLSNNFIAGSVGVPAAGVPGSIASLSRPFSPVPFGPDLYAEFGQERSLPLLGNFDPPVAATSSPSQSGTTTGDMNGDSLLDGADVLSWQRNLGRTGVAANAAGNANHDAQVNAADLSMWQAAMAAVSATASPTGDVTGDGEIDGADVLLWQRNLGSTGASSVPGDANQDRQVTGADLTIIRQALTTATATSASLTVAPRFADATSDGLVDGADVLLWQRQLGNSSPARTDADPTGDGRVEATDLTRIVADFGLPTIVSGASSDWAAVDAVFAANEFLPVVGGSSLAMLRRYRPQVRRP